MCSLHLFIIIALVIFEVFRASTASKFNFSDYSSLQKNLARNDFNGVYNHDIKIRPKNRSDLYSQTYQIYLRDLTLDDGEEFQNLTASKNINLKEHFYENKNTSYQNSIIELGSLDQVIPATDAKDVRQLIEEKKMSKAKEVRKTPLIGLDQIKAQKLVKQDTLISIDNDVNTNKKPNGMKQTVQNNPSIPERSEVITCNGQQYTVSMPAEISVRTHSYEEPMGLTLDEVRLIRDQVLCQTNMYRKRHGCKALNPNENMNNHAQEWANYLASSRTLIPRKSDQNDEYGETLYTSAPMEVIGKVAVNTWYNQLRFIHVGDDDEALNQNSKRIQNIVQLLWKKSKEIGVGVAKSACKEYFIVANYNPKGNVYPFLLDNLPVFTQNDIDLAQKAHEVIPEKMVIKNVESNQLGQLVTNSENANQINGSQQYTNSRPITESNDPDECPKMIKLKDENGNTQYALSPVFKDPIPYPYKKPHGFSPSEVEKIRQDVLAKSNYYRVQMYNLKPLVLNIQINNFSQEWANYLAETNQFRHRSDTNENGRTYGENLYISTEVLHVGEVAVDLWYYEISYLGVNDNAQTISNNHDAGHLTQLLWKSSRQMGVGAAVSEKGKFIVVVNYNPPGNSVHFYSYNLPRFTQKQIDEGKILQKNVDKYKNTPVAVPSNGQLPKLQGWSSQLYRD